MIVVNIGNTHLRWLAFEGEQIVDSGRVPTREAVLQPPTLPPGPVALVSVVPGCRAALLPVWTAEGRSVFDVNGAVDLGLVLAYTEKQRLGADRLANAVALWHGFGPGIVVDAGTATTLTVVDETGVLRGGAIMPGLTTARDSLWQGTAQLPAVSLEIPEKSVGESTEAGLRAGLVLGHIGAVLFLIQRMRQEVPSARTLIVTGGWGALLSAELPAAQYVADLTLLGARWAWLNANK
ncbi:MAG: type III pantothenate kinase [Candidatus Sericytochromatia bacterium]|nr:type III pantothenate kinase [Candidatus Sericytochromatia bacterium]